MTHYNNPKLLAEVSEDLGEAMVGLTMCVSDFLQYQVVNLGIYSDKNLKGGRMSERGW